MEESSVHSCPVPEGHADGPLHQLPDMSPAEECLDTGYDSRHHLATTFPSPCVHTLCHVTLLCVLTWVK